MRQEALERDDPLNAALPLAVIGHADLRKASLEFANLRHATFRTSSFCGAHLNDADLADSIMPKFPNLLGISVNSGAQYTNDPHVKLLVKAPALASSILVSNDGGFLDRAAP